MSEAPPLQENPITTLSAFFQHSGAQYQLFDMGRRVVSLSPETFEQFERCKQAYAFPLQRHALVGVIFWDATRIENRYVWFLKLPLDEQGLLIPQARDAFLMMLLDRVGESMMAAADGQKIEGALKDSPYTFKPREEKMAAFNALATSQLQLPPSQYFDLAQQYFTGQITANNWQQLAMQGVADFAVRLTAENEVKALADNLANLPAVPFQTLCSFLENTQTPKTLVEAFAEILSKSLQASQPDIAKIAACLRAVSHSQETVLVSQMLEQTMTHEVSKDVEVLAVIGGRCWTWLADLKLAQMYCEQLAENNAGQPGFSQLLADLLYLPGIRTPLMQVIRSESRSEALTAAVGEMFGR